MKIQIVKEHVRQLDISHLRDIFLRHHEQRLANTTWWKFSFKQNSSIENNWLPSGQSEYRLYAYLSTFFNRSIILDIGTKTGGSALALSYNPTNKVISYDLVEQGASSLKKENIIWKIMNFMEDQELNLDDVSIIVIDVDPHDGSQERNMMNWLREKDWKGLLIHDDIGPDWPDMNLMWEEIPEEKFDVTDIAHASGTGIVNFGNVHEISIV